MWVCVSLFLARWLKGSQTRWNQRGFASESQCFWRLVDAVERHRRRRATRREAEWGRGSLERKHHLAHCIISRACQWAKHVAKRKIYCLKMDFIARKNKKKEAPIPVVLSPANLCNAFSQLLSMCPVNVFPLKYKYLNMSASGCREQKSYFHFVPPILHFHLCLFEPKCSACTLPGSARALSSSGFIAAL